MRCVTETFDTTQIALGGSDCVRRSSTRGFMRWVVDSHAETMGAGVVDCHPCPIFDAVNCSLLLIYRIAFKLLARRISPAHSDRPCLAVSRENDATTNGDLAALLDV